MSSVLTVGSGQQFATLSAAIAASHDGDTIYVEAGVYVNDFAVINTKVDIVGVGGMAHFIHDGSVSIPNGKAIFVTNTDVSFDHIEFSGAKVADQNGAGIRYQGGNLAITNCYFHNNQNGILGAASLGGTVTIERSEFGFNGKGDGLTHNLYVNAIATLSIKNSYFHDAIIGHEIKSRAANTIVMDSRIFDLNGTASYSIDLPNGGSAIIQNNIIQQGPNSVNSGIIAYAAKEVSFPNSSLLVTGNTIINQLNKPSSKGVVNFSTIPVQITDNDFYGLTSVQIVSGPSSQTGNDFLGSLPVMNTSHPWEASPWDELFSGGSASDVLIGSAGSDLLVGGDGADTFGIKVQGGSDTIADFVAGVGIGDVVKLDGYALTDIASVKKAMTTSGSDTVLNLGSGQTLTFLNVSPSTFAADDFTFVNTGNAGPQPFVLPVSSASTVVIAGDSYANVLVGTSGHDSINGRAGVDTMKGSSGDDTYNVNTSFDLVVENANQGIDTVVATASSYTLPANVENLTLSGKTSHLAMGNALNNLIKTSSGSDTIDAGAGNDIIKAGIGANIIAGGAGNDMIVFSATGAHSRIIDFLVGEDLLDLRLLIGKAGYRGDDPVADGIIALSSDGSGVIVSVDPTESGTMTKLVTLVGVAPGSLDMGIDLLWQ